MRSRKASNVKTLTPQIQMEFTALMRKHGGLLLTRDVVKAAENPKSTLHQYFTWDDSEAAELWRQNEAMELIGSFKIYNEELQINVRALTSLDTDRMEEGGYRWTTEVLKRPDLKEQMLSTALHELHVIQNRYQHIQELAGVWDAVEQVELAPEQSIRSTKVTA